MNYPLKFLFYLCLILCFSFTSCDSDGEDDDLSGIQLATTRSSGESDGIGLACNFSQIIKEYLNDEDLDELYEEAQKGGEEGEFNKEEFEELIDMIFNGFNKTMYMIVAGDNIGLENTGEVEVAGETFSISWFSDTDEPMPGTYEAIAAKINVENPDDLKNGAEISNGEIEVVLAELTDEFMVGTFSGQITNSEGVAEEITGAFNVERASCQQ